MVRAILTERQTGDSYVTCRFEFSLQEKFHAYGTQAGWKTSMHCFVQVLFDALANMYTVRLLEREQQIKATFIKHTNFLYHLYLFLYYLTYLFIS